MDFVVGHIAGFPVEEGVLFALPSVVLALTMWWGGLRARRAARAAGRTPVQSAGSR